MGLFDRKTTNSTTNLTENNLDASVSGNQGPVLQDGSYLSNVTNVTTMDAGAISAAADLVGKTIAANSSGQQAAYALAGDLGKGAFDLSAYTTNIVAKVTRENAADAMASTNKSASAAMEIAAGSARDSIAANAAAMRDTLAYTSGVNTTLAKTYDAALGMTGSMSAKVMDALTSANKESNGVAANAISQVNRAWGDAKQAEKDLAGGDYRMLMIIGAAVIGVVAVMGMVKK